MPRPWNGNDQHREGHATESGRVESNAEHFQVRLVQPGPCRTCSRTLDFITVLEATEMSLRGNMTTFLLLNHHR